MWYMYGLERQVHRFLRWTEHFFKTDMVYLVRGGFWLSFGQLASAFFSFFVSIVFANYLSKETFGIYRYIISAAALLGAFTLTGIGNAAIQAIARGHEKIIRDGFALSLRWHIFFIIASFAAAVYYYFNGNLTLAFLFLIAGSFSPIINSASIYASYLQGKGEFQRNGIYNIARGAFPSFFLIIGATLFDDPIAIALIYFVSNATIVYWLHQQTIEKLRPNNSKDEKTIPFAKHSSLINVLSIVSDKLDSVLLFQNIGAAELAVYTFAIAIPETLNGFVKNLIPLALPKFAARDKNETQNALLQKMLRVLLVLIPLTAIYILLVPFVFKWFFPHYLESIIYAQLWGLSLLINGALPIAFFESQMAIKEKYILSIVSNVLKIGLIIFGVLTYGILGAIAAKLIAKVFGLFLAIFLIRRM